MGGVAPIWIGLKNVRSMSQIPTNETSWGWIPSWDPGVPVSRGGNGGTARLSMSNAAPAGKKPEGLDGVEVVAMMFLSLYQILNLSRAMDKKKPQGEGA